MTCHQSLGKGGLGIFNFQTKSDSLKLASLICNLEDRESKSFFLTKYFLGSRLASCRPEWRSLRDNSTPSTQNLTPYYEKCFSVLTTLRGIVSTTCIYCLSYQFSLFSANQHSNPQEAIYFVPNVFPNKSMWVS